jgi:hypothetical protein
MTRVAATKRQIELTNVMRHSQRLIAAGVLFALCSVLASCGGGGMSSFDPSDMLDFLDTKKKLPGDRKPVFPEGVPGLEQGVPKDLYKGAVEERLRDEQQAAVAPVQAEPKPQTTTNPKAKAKAKRKPETPPSAPSDQDAASPDDEAAPAPAPPPKPAKRVQRAAPPPPQQPPQDQQQPAAQQSQSAPSAFPAPLPSGSFSR